MSKNTSNPRINALQAIRSRIGEMLGCTMVDVNRQVCDLNDDLRPLLPPIFSGVHVAIVRTGDNTMSCSFARDGIGLLCTEDSLAVELFLERLPMPISWVESTKNVVV